MSAESTIVAIFPADLEAEAFLEQLQRDGFPMRNVSLLGRDNHADEEEHWQRLGTYWGRLWGCLFGASFLGIPGIGPLVVGGRFARQLLAALSRCGDDERSILAMSFEDFRIPVSSIPRYEDALRDDHYLIILEELPVGEAMIRLIRKQVEELGGTACVENASPAPV